MLALTGGKGGCGKTTTALGLGWTLARRGHSPLVVDADCDMPDLHHVARIERDSGTDALAEGAPPAEAARYSDRFPGVALVTAGRPDRLGAALRATTDWPGPVLVDCPAGVGPDATRPLRPADTAILVSTDEPQCLDDSRRTARVCRQLGTDPAGALLVLSAVTPWNGSEPRGAELCRGRTADSARAVVEPVDRVPETVGSCPVLARVPSVTDPFDAPVVARAWHRVADAAVPAETQPRV